MLIYIMHLQGEYVPRIDLFRISQNTLLDYCFAKIPLGMCFYLIESMGQSCIFPFIPTPCLLLIGAPSTSRPV